MNNKGSGSRSLSYSQAMNGAKFRFLLQSIRIVHAGRCNGLKMQDRKTQTKSCVFAIKTGLIVGTNSEGCQMPKKLQGDDHRSDGNLPAALCRAAARALRI